MPMNEGYTVMPSGKKSAKPQVAKRVADRKAFVAAKTAEKGITPAQARQRFYVQTRMSELKAAGKPVDAAKRKELQKKFQSGDVARKGFAAPKKKTGGSSSSSSSTPKATAKVAPRSATSNMKGVSGFGRTDASGRTGMGATAPKKATGAVASQGQAIRKADKSAASQRRVSGTTRGKGKY